MNAYDIILRPVITEQSMEAVADKKYVFQVADRKSTRLNSSHIVRSRMPSSA